MRTTAGPGTTSQRVGLAALRVATASGSGLYVMSKRRSGQRAKAHSCSFQRFLKIPCPGCGMTRALVSLSRGNVRVSLRQHPFALGVALYFGVLQAAGISEI